MKDVLDVADFDTDEQILKRMEEILFTYKTKVEDKLAAEGKALPKVCFLYINVLCTYSYLLLSTANVNIIPLRTSLMTSRSTG